MAVYIGTTILAVVISIFSMYAKKKNRTLFVVLAILAALPLFCVAAFRYNVGTDYPYTYTQRFIWRLDGFDLSEIFEFGFIWLIDLVQLFTTNPQWLFIVCAAIFTFFVFKAIYQQSNWVPYSILMLVIGGHFFANLNLMRNFMALAIFLYAFKYIRQRRLLPFTIWMIIAFSFHSSIIILYPLYFIYQIKLSRNATIIIIALTVICLPVLDVIFEFIITKLQYGWYYRHKESNITLLTSTIVVNVVTLAIQLYYYNKNKDDLLYNMYMKVQLLTTLIAICSGILPMARRLILLPSFLQILSIPYITNKEENKKKKWIINIGICVMFTVFTIRQITVQEMHSVLPYQSIFSL